MSKKSKTNQVKEILQTAIDEASMSQYCMTCEFAYLRIDDGNGYCKFQLDDVPYRGGYLKPIHEYATCDHWRKKEK